MSNIYEIIDSLDLEQAEVNKLKIYLIKNREMKEELFSALTSSYQTKEVQQILLKEFLETIPDKHQEKRSSNAELLYEQEKMKRTRLEALLDATTHSLSSLWYIYQPIHCQTLWFEPARKSLSFATPPTGDKENVYQSYFREQILSQLEKDNYVKAVDTHSKKILDGKAPDICTHLDDYSLTPHTIESIGEIKPHGSCFTPTNQGQVIMYATIALKHQKGRQSITGFLTDCYHVMFIQVTKDDSVKGPYKVTYSDQFNLSNQTCTNYLRGLLSTLSYHPMTGLSVKMNDLIAYTSLSSVFGVFYDEDAVVKIVSRSDILMNEINVLTKLQRRGVNDGIIRLVGSSDTAMLLRPRAVETFKECNKPVSLLADIIEKIKKCHENGIVHGDTRLTNILVDKNGKLILIDFGCGSDAGKEWYGNGPRLPLLSLRLIRLTTTSTFAGRWNPQIFTDYRDDLFTLIQSIYIHLNKDYVLQVLENNIEDPNHVISFWDKVFVDEWKIAYDYCNNLNYDGLKFFIANL
ncbi:hypothetical protein C1645_823920 [Glomus cerebriforme]|uniref:DUF6826 domain-containing protein n=1 Tax=Glomus cerebriforme TaxID=658196 RepID=A0A397T4T7_9GLOM|nr:hypothetical protein C1645_823920 [Glomus cerebriforme]